MQDVAGHVRGGGQMDDSGLDLPVDAAVNPDLVGENLALDVGCFADEQRLGADVPFDRAVDLHFALTDQIADQAHVGTDQ